MSKTVQTVLGETSLDNLGRILPHEHILGAYCQGLNKNLQFIPPSRDKILEQHKHLLATLVHEYDCRTLVECSPWGMRRVEDLEIWAELSRRTGINIVACTGYYVGALRPPDFSSLTVSTIADGMIREAEEGILGTGVKASIIKIAIDDFDEKDRKLCQAAAITQKETGLSITTHTCSPDIRRGVLDFLEGAGVPPERICLGHADDNATLPELLALLKRGCNVLLTIWGIQNTKFIGWQLPSLPKYHSPGLVAGIAAEGYASQVLISIDYAAGLEYAYYEVDDRNYLYMFSHVIHDLRHMGVPDRTIELIMRENPKRMLSRY